MSESEFIYLDTDLSVQEVVEVLADRLGLDVLPSPAQDGLTIVRARDLAGAGFAGGPVSLNTWRDDDDPEDRTVYDEYPIEWQIWSERPRPDYGPQQQAARILFDLVVRRVGWPCVLLSHDGQRAVARFHPSAGIEDFPDHTSAFITGEPVWGRGAARVDRDAVITTDEGSTREGS